MRENRQWCAFQIESGYESQMNSALPLMFSSGTAPQNRESFELSRLSPIAKTWPLGTT